MDTWQYTLHRLFHTIPFLYKHIHSWHHRLYIPFAYSALYNHPIEGFLLDLIGSVVAMEASRMTVRQSIALFAIATAKTIHDHSGWSLPLDPMQFLFKNNSDYHDIHHQVSRQTSFVGPRLKLSLQAIGIKSNFSQPFFVHWDRLLGTELTRTQVEERRRVNRARRRLE
jgi:sphinganine C4-monooxygenase